MYRSRYIVTGSLVLILLAAFALVALIPAYLVLVRAGVAVEESTTVVGVPADDPTAIVRAQTLVDSFTPILHASVSPTTLIEAALAIKPAGASIDRISYRIGQIVVSGQASRETIEAYRNALLADTRFESVSVPVSSLVGRDGSRFSITLSGNF